LHLLELQYSEDVPLHPDQRRALGVAVAAVRATLAPHWLEFLDAADAEIVGSCSTEEQNAAWERFGLELVRG
jgi:hypothetical protein